MMQMISYSYLPIRPCIKMNLYLVIICDSSSVTVKKSKEPFLKIVENNDYA